MNNFLSPCFQPLPHLNQFNLKLLDPPPQKRQIDYKSHEKFIDAISSNWKTKTSHTKYKKKNFFNLKRACQVYKYAIAKY